MCAKEQEEGLSAHSQAQFEKKHNQLGRVISSPLWYDADEVM